MKKYNDNAYKLTVCKYPVKNFGFEEGGIKQNRNINDNKLYNNLIRAKMKVFEYSMCNNFEYFVTLTLSPEKYDRYNLTKFIKDLGQFIRDYRKKNSVNIQYLLIPEQHENGAWHMHGLMKGIPEEHLVLNDNGYKDWKAYSEKFGYMSIDNIRNQEAVSKYITKYISKSIDVGKGVTEKNKKLYYASRGLKTAEIIKKGMLSAVEIESIPWQFENDYVKTVMLSNEDLKKVIDIIK